MTVDWNGTNYYGLTLARNDQKQYVDISMPGYIANLLTHLAHKRSSRAVHAPHQWSKPIFGCHIQHGTPDNTSNKFSDSEIKLIQLIEGA